MQRGRRQILAHFWWWWWEDGQWYPRTVSTSFFTTAVYHCPSSHKMLQRKPAMLRPRRDLCVVCGAWRVHLFVAALGGG